MTLRENLTSMIIIKINCTVSKQYYTHDWCSSIAKKNDLFSFVEKKLNTILRSLRIVGLIVIYTHTTGLEKQSSFLPSYDLLRFHSDFQYIFFNKFYRIRIDNKHRSLSIDWGGAVFMINNFTNMYNVLLRQVILKK